MIVAAVKLPEGGASPAPGPRLLAVPESGDGLKVAGPCRETYRQKKRAGAVHMQVRPRLRTDRPQKRPPSRDARRRSAVSHSGCVPPKESQGRGTPKAYHSQHFPPYTQILDGPTLSTPQQHKRGAPAPAPGRYPLRNPRRRPCTHRSGLQSCGGASCVRISVNLSRIFRVSTDKQGKSGLGLTPSVKPWSAVSWWMQRPFRTGSHASGRSELDRPNVPCCPSANAGGGVCAGGPTEL
jgi:hypothetical protein